MASLLEVGAPRSQVAKPDAGQSIRALDCQVRCYEDGRLERQSARSLVGSLAPMAAAYQTDGDKDSSAVVILQYRVSGPSP